MEEKIKVLIAEDESDIREPIAEILLDEGFEVFEARNGREAFEIFLDKKPNVIVSDIMMPELDGYGLLKLVRESRDKNNVVPFIFLSALGQKENIIKGATLSANDYLVKPVDFEILIAKIKEKAQNNIKVQKTHEKGIKNIKSQIATALPAELSSHIDSMVHLLKILKEEPYGPFPHRRYLEDINKLYFDVVKLKSVITNSLDQNVIDSRLNADEEIFSISHFIEQAILNLPEKIRHRVRFDKPYESEILPKIKIDKNALIDIVKTFIAGIIKSEANSSIAISLVIDNLNQMVLIFYINSNFDIDQIFVNVDGNKIQKISDLQSLYFKISGSKGNINATLTIPSFRVI